MSWVTVIWSMNAGACLTLAAFYGAVWFKQRANRAYLLFSCSAIAAAVISAFELWMLNATTVEQYQRADALDPCAGVGAHAVSLSLLSDSTYTPDDRGWRGASTPCELWC